MVRTAFHAVAAASLCSSARLSCALRTRRRTSRGQNLVGPTKWNPSSQSVSTAYWTLEPGWNTDLEMRNNLRSRELTITPVLRAATGEELSLAPVTVAPQHVVSLNLRSLAKVNPKVLSTSAPSGRLYFASTGSMQITSLLQPSFAGRVSRLISTLTAKSLDRVTTPAASRECGGFLPLARLTI